MESKHALPNQPVIQRIESSKWGWILAALVVVLLVVGITFRRSPEKPPSDAIALARGATEASAGAALRETSRPPRQSLAEKSGTVDTKNPRVLPVLGSRKRAKQAAREPADEIGAVLAAANAAAAPTHAPPLLPSGITNPDWSQRPSADDVARYYPERAQRLEVSGRAELSCQVLADGKLAGCSVVSEDPPDQQFGEAALKLSRLFKMRPMTRDGAPTNGGTVHIPIRFQIAKG